MTVDIQKSILSSLYNTLTADTTLKTAMGGTVRLYPVWAEVDAEFPYLVHRIDMANVGDRSPQRRCTYYLDIWSDSANAEEILSIRKQIMTLIDNMDSSTDETTEFFMWIQSDGFIPETTPNIWHYAMQFNLKYLRDEQIGVVYKR